MLKKTDFSEFEPLVRLRAHLGAADGAFVDSLLDVIDVPLDQPHCASVIAQLSSSLVSYAATLGEVKAGFARLIEKAARVADVVSSNREEIEGTPPVAQLHGRVSDYPVWALGMSLRDEHVQLRVALGAGIALALVRCKQVSGSLCSRLRRDIGKLGHFPRAAQVTDPRKLAAVGFGASWIKSFERTDAIVKQLVCKEPPKPRGKHRLSTEQLISHITQRQKYPNAAMRKGIQNDSCMPPHAMREIAATLRSGTEAGHDDLFLATACVLTGLSVQAILGVPLCDTFEDIQGLGLCRDGTAFALDLHCVFPARSMPDELTARLFKQAGDIAPLLTPDFFAQEVARRVAANADATTIGDLVCTTQLTARSSIIEDDTRKLYASLARASKSLGPLALSLGADRLNAAFQTWFFWVINRSRIYYSRVRYSELATTAEKIYAFLDWPFTHGSRSGAFGSRCVLQPDAVARIFSYFAARVVAQHPGRRGGLERVLAHHSAYAIYTAALLTFCIGARETDRYEIAASNTYLGQRQLVLNDKGTTDDDRAAPVPLSAIVREQLRQWRAHCAAVAARLRNENDRRAVELRIRLEEVSRCAPTYVLVACIDEEITSLGSRHVWGSLPAELQVPANVGRHFWADTLRANQLGCRDIGRFLRHRTLMLDPNDCSVDSILADSLERICAVQERVLSEMAVRVVTGLRKA